MSYLYPRYEILQQNFASSTSFGRPQNGLKPKVSRYQARPELYGAYSVVDDAKSKTKQLGAEATKEFERASAAAQAKAGTIELYSGKYYAACTFGGLLACVSLSHQLLLWLDTNC
jgi:solute carrier family 25 (mitochondrial phosphate transporter), member 3